ncbi:MAG: hypothetical protein LBS75_05415 [Synergistaceae bacterium]|jgi:hypothetical protein|nr:hypothetical protein [Synergistaceae bacterium]
MIESFAEGRVRLRSPILADEAFARHLESGLRGIAGVTKAEANARTHGLLLEYDRGVIPISVLMATAAMFARLGELEDAPPESRASMADGILRDLSEALAENRGIRNGRDEPA